MAIASLYPTIKPSLLLDFANSKKLDPRVTFTRSTTAVYYDGVTTALAEQNIVRFSQEFNSWTNVNLPVTADNEVAPDGTTTADTLTATSNSQTLLYPPAPGISVYNDTYTASVYVKAGTADYAVFSFWAGSGTNGINLWIDVQNGTTGSNSATSGYTFISASSTSVGSGWYRITLTGTVPLATSSYLSIRIVDADGGFAYTTVAGKTLVVWGAQLEQRAAATAYVATGSDVVQNYVPQLLTAPAGVPRFDHNPTTGESLGLLVEEQRTNTATWSESFRTQTLAVTGVSGTFVDGETVTATGGGTGTYVLADSTGSSFAIFNGSGTFTGTLTGGASGATATISSSVTNWQQGSPVSVLITANTVVAPNGTLTGDQITDNAANSPHLIFQGWTPPSSNFTLSFYAKYNNIPWVYIGYFTYGCAFNIQTGVAGTPTSNATNPTIVPVGNGWYRCSINITNSVGADAIIVGVGTTDAYKPSYVGTGSSAFIWGVQAENGAFPTSYIPTTSASVTRTADDAMMTGANFFSWFDPANGSLYANITPIALGGGNGVMVSDGTLNNSILLAAISTSEQARILSLGTIQTLDGGTPVAGAETKLAVAYATDDFALSLNGGSVATDTSGGLPVAVRQFQIGARTTTVGSLTIKKIAYYPERLTNAQLQALTA